MKLDWNIPFIAGMTDTTVEDAPNLVFAFPSFNNSLPADFTPNPEYFSEGDVILVGPLGENGRIDPAQCAVYLLDADLTPRRIRFSEFHWENQLRVYQPISNLAAYRRGAEAQRQANKVLDL